MLDNAPGLKAMLGRENDRKRAREGERKIEIWKTKE